jgi:4-hydroxy-tetrahydrodipicolinate synthase
VVPPFFFKEVTDEAVFAFYARLIDAVGDPRLRLYLYHIPQISGVGIAPAVAGRLAEAFPGVLAGIKDSAGEWDNTAALLARVPRLDVLVGHEPHLPQLMRAGGAGTICGIANVFPGMVRALLAPRPGSDDEARIRRFIEVLFRYPFLPAFKAIKAAQANDGAWRAVRTPWMPLSDETRATLLRALDDAGFAVQDQGAQQ